MTATQTKPQITSLPIAEIEPIEGLNPRGKITDDNTAELTASIDQLGMLMPVLVAERTNGHWPLIAGARRLHAARKLKLKEIPALVRADLGGSELEAAIVENAQREDLDPVEEAIAIKRLIDEKGLKQVDAAKAMGKSERWLRERLRLLKLPAHTQRIFAARQIPIEAAVQLEKVAKLSPDAADLIAVHAKQGKIAAGELAGTDGIAHALDEILTEVDQPMFVQVVTGQWGGQSYTPADLPVNSTIAAALKTEWEEIPKVGAWYGDTRGRRAEISFDRADAEAARKAGCLLDLDYDDYGVRRSMCLIAGEEFIAERVREKLPKLKKAAQRKLREYDKQRQENEERKAQRGHTDSGAGAETAAERDAERAAQQAEVEALNHELGERLGALELTSLTPEVVQLLCSMALGNEEYLDDAVYGSPGLVGILGLSDDEDGPGPGEQLLERLAAADSAEAQATLVLRFITAVRFSRDPDRPRDTPGWSFAMFGPEHHPKFGLDFQVDELAEQLDLLPAASTKWAKEQAETRQKIRNEAAERAARVEAAKAEKAGEDESK